jgi:hypothetical protein
MLAGILVAGCLCAKEAPGTHRQAMIFVDAADGFNVYLTAAIEKQHVPVTVTIDKSQADYEVGATHDGKEAGIRLIDLKSQRVVFAYSVERRSAGRAEQAAAVEFARRLAATVNPHLPSRRRSSKLASLLATDPAFDF